ncbi:CASP-like protein 3A1 [Rutidosis leptorrhynchoides]|uniref:CASP-like protein 3A1 n=1 Tax=Rutidosis leptorrhynchoides TaxID=125765 RepID=UPI003A99436B
MTNDHKPPPLETTIQLPDHTTITKVAAEVETGTMNLGPMITSTKKFSLNYDVMHIILRFVSLAASLISVFVMISAKEKSSILIYGFNLPLYSKWSFSGSFKYLVGVSAVVGVHSLVQLLMTTSRTLRKSSVFSSRNHAWLIFTIDQVFAYVMVSAGSAATGVTNLNRTGIKHASLPNFCKPLHHFCDRVGVSIAFAFFNCVLLAISAVLDVIWLSN